MEKSKNILITGVSTGIGHELTSLFLEKRYTVFGSVRKEKDAEKLIKEFGHSFKPLIFDVTDHEAVDAAVNIVAKEAGHLGGLINNAGIALGGPLLYLPIEELRYQFEVNVIGLMKVTQAFAPLLGARDNHAKEPGRIVQISSVSGEIGMPFIGPYVGSKHAVEGISKVLRRELLKFGIDVIVFGPGAVKTPIWQKGESQVERWSDTPYSVSLGIFRKFVGKLVDTAIPSEELARQIVQAFEAKKPKPRYAPVSRKLSNWIVPRLLPTRTLDRMIAKNLKLEKGD